MARREWAERKAKAGVQFISVLTDGEVHGLVTKLLQAEHARAVRIVKATRKRVAQDTATYNDVERIIIDVVLQGLMDDLQKGRA